MSNYKFLLHPRSTSQANQESFVLNMHEWKRGGTYVEIGACHPTENSNSNILETEFGWKGFGVEIDPARAATFNSRENPCVIADAMELDYLSVFKELNLPNQIDYLQVDVEPAEHSLKALEKVLVDGYRFSVITFEHDLYAAASNEDIKNQARGILFSRGYILVADLVKDFFTYGVEFEDWFIDPLAIKEDIWSQFKEDYRSENNTLFTESYE